MLFYKVKTILDPVATLEHVTLEYLHTIMAPGPLQFQTFTTMQSTMVDTILSSADWLARLLLKRGLNMDERGDKAILYFSSCKYL